MRNRCGSTIGMAIKCVAALLPYFSNPNWNKMASSLLAVSAGKVNPIRPNTPIPNVYTTSLCHINLLNADKSGQFFKGNGLLFQTKQKDFFQVLVKLIQTGRLGVRTCNRRHNTHIELCVGVIFNISGQRRL